MKTKINIIGIISVVLQLIIMWLIILTTNFISDRLDKIEENQQIRHDQIMKKVTARLDHFESCSFLDLNDIDFGHDGYIFSKTHRKIKRSQ